MKFDYIIGKPDPDYGGIDTYFISLESKISKISLFFISRSMAAYRKGFVMMSLESLTLIMELVKRNFIFILLSYHEIDDNKVILTRKNTWRDPF